MNVAKISPLRSWFSLVKFQRQKKSENKEILVNWERRGESLDGNITVRTMKVIRKSSA